MRPAVLRLSGERFDADHEPFHCGAAVKLKTKP
jgi:hypothetical protein